jgi:hypothetical protein
MPILKDSRRYPRIPVDWPVVIQKRDGARDADLTDISLKGAFIRSDKPLKPKERSKLFIIVPNRKTFRVYFEVVWLRVDCSENRISPCGMGIRFTRVSSTDRQFLSSFLARD